MRNVILLLKMVVVGVIGVILQLLLHEAGYAIAVALTGNTLTNITFGLDSYSTIEIINERSIPIILLGSFALPIIVCLLLNIFKNKYVSILNIVILTITTIRLFMNNTTVIFVVDSEFYKYDLGMYIAGTEHNNILIGIISQIIKVLMICWLFLKLRKFVDNYAYEF